jgi:hypothetical protein
MCESMLSPGLSISTRRRATVTISHPDPTIAATIAALEENLPVPTSNLDRNFRPAITSSSIWDPISSI